MILEQAIEEREPCQEVMTNEDRHRLGTPRKLMQSAPTRLQPQIRRPPTGATG
jgi:hypothetical protein